MIKIIINGIPQKIDSKTTISDLLKKLNIQNRGTAVAVNDRVVPRSQHEETEILIGDRLEIIRAIGGG